MTATIFGTGPAINVNVNGTLVPEHFTATPGQTVFNITLFDYEPGTNSLQVYNDGNKLVLGLHYTETDRDTFTLITPCVGGEIIEAIGFPELDLNALNIGGVNYTASDVNAVARSLQSKLDEIFVTPEDFGAVRNADSTTALKNWALSTLPKKGLPYTYITTETVLFINSSDIQWNQMVVDGNAGGTWTDNAIVKSQGAITLITGGLAANLTKGVSIIVQFVFPHGLAENDVFCIYDRRDSIFNPAHTYYRSGEDCKVLSIVDPNTVRLWSPVWHDYNTANCDVYKLTPHEVNWENLTVIAPTTGFITPIKVQFGTRTRMKMCYGRKSNYTSLSFDRCYDTILYGDNVDVNPLVAASKYGVIFGNCQEFQILGGQYNAVRHAVLIGGDDFICCIPNRNGYLGGGASFKNDPNTSGVPCLDVHGNAENIRYEDCNVYGGASFNGKDIFYRKVNFLGADVSIGAMVVGGSECLGGILSVENCYLQASGAYALGMVRGFGDATNLQFDAHLIVKDNSMRMDATDTFVRFDASHATLKQNAHVCNNTYIDGTGIPVQIVRMSGPGSATDGNYVTVEGVHNFPVDSTFYTAVNGYGATVKVSLPTQIIDVVVAPGAAVNNSSTAGTWRYKYGSKLPKVTCGWDTDRVNGLPIAACVSAKSSTGATGKVYTCGGAVFGAAAPNVTVTITAGLSEI